MRKNAQLPTFNAQRSIRMLVALSLVAGLCVSADTHYVDINCATPTAPYTNWATAATVLQVAVDFASAGDLIKVTNGVYSIITTANKAITIQSVNGWTGTAIDGGATNRCARLGSSVGQSDTVLLGFTLRNGKTTEYGGGSYYGTLSNCMFVGNSAFYGGGGAAYSVLNGCVLASNSATWSLGAGGGAYNGVLNYCTLSNNMAGGGGGGSSGGALTGCILMGNVTGGSGGGSSSGALTNCSIVGNVAIKGGGAGGGILYNCTLSGNRATDQGGGSYNGNLNNCTLSGNSGAYGGGSYYGTLNNCLIYANTALYGGGGSDYGVLNNCTLSGNTANYGGGASSGKLNNCIVYHNNAVENPNTYWSTLCYSCTTPKGDDLGNIDEEPRFVSIAHVAPDSPCVGAGSSLYTSGRDIDGDTWGSPPSMGCDELRADAMTGMLRVAICAEATNMIVQGRTVHFEARIDGRVCKNVWSYGDGNLQTNCAYASHAWNGTGSYDVVLKAYNETNPEGVAATQRVNVIAVHEHARYVREDSPSPSLPYDSWTNAARTIQEAVDAQKIVGGWVWVSNGVYSTGTRVTPGGTLSNRVVITNNIVVKSVNGPAFTLIAGQGAGTGGTNGSGAVRCVYITAGSLDGFTLTNGHTQISRNYNDHYIDCSGGGAYAYGGELRNCALLGNSAYWFGGGSIYGNLYNCTVSGNSASAYSSGGGGSRNSNLYSCTVSGNSADSGGGSYQGSLYNCTVTGNSASSGGGSFCSSLYNCIVYYNSAAKTGNNYWTDWGGSLSYSCTTPLPSAGIGNITNIPQLVSSGRIASTSPCRGRGSQFYATGADLDGEGWLNPPSMGCDEYVTGALTGTLSVAIKAAYTNVAVGCSVGFIGSVGGKASRSVWTYGDGVAENNAVRVTHGWGAVGVYPVVLTAFNESWLGGVSATVQVSVVSVPEYYVNVGNPTPTYPYTSWAMAATNIQDAVDVPMIPGAWVWVTNGVYATGGRAVAGTMTNRVFLGKPVVIKSVNGSSVTVIRGSKPVGPNAVRCAYVGDGAALIGFTLTNGASDRGAGVWCELSGVVSNCVIVDNSAGYGGGSYQGSLYNCTMSGNSASSSGGGSYAGSLYNCTVSGNSASPDVGNGGGSFYCNLYNCTVSGNSAFSGGGNYKGSLYNCTVSGNSSFSYGGGSCDGSLFNCTVRGNSAACGGGGSYAGCLYNCTVIGNSATNGQGGGSYHGNLYNCTVSSNSASDSGGGSYGCNLGNCIVYYNTAPTSNNYCITLYNESLSYSCTTPLPSGPGNITNDPQFADTSAANFRLKATSPCIDKGQNSDWIYTSTDLDGNPRIRNSIVDMGAYEFAFSTDLRGMLQGPYNTNSHKMATLSSTNLPTRSRYAADARTVAVKPSNTVDWALMEVQDTTGVSLASMSVFLDPMGRVMDAAGGTNIAVEVLTGNYYLVLKHRNHLAAMSAMPVAFTNTVVSYDFTTGPDKYFGGSNACVRLEPGVWGLIGGDADGDGKITPVDRIIVERQRGKAGYLQGDLNLDGKVDGGD